MIDDGKPEGIAETFVYSQPGMLVTEPLAGAQMFTPGRAIHVLIELAIQITLDSLLFQSADGTARFAARFQEFVTQRAGHKSVAPFAKT
jgi:hypothetical protein